MTTNILKTANQLRAESRAYAAFIYELAARFDPLGRVELTYRYVAAYKRIEFRLNHLPPWAVSACFLADLPAVAVDAAELHFRQAETYRRWTRALA